MDFLFINQKVYIRRTDGRIHQARIVKLDGGTNQIVTVEWNEGPVTHGKEVPIGLIIALNPQVYRDDKWFPPARPIFPLEEADMMASVRPRPTGGEQQPERAPAMMPPRQEIVAGAVTRMPRREADKSEDDVVANIERLRINREMRRQKQNEERAARDSYMEADSGNPNWEVAQMIRTQRFQLMSKLAEGITDVPLSQHQIMVCVRKRPLSRRELASSDPDVITVPNREILVVHEPRKHVDLTKYLENHSFRFDCTFDDKCTNSQVYERTGLPLVWHIFEGGMATCFAYGQTGSGKTHTMGGVFTGKKQNCRDGIYGLAARDVFELLKHSKYAHLNLRVSCSFFELYGTRVYDLLRAGKPELRVLEDGHQKVQVVGLTEERVANTGDVLKALELGNSVRTCGRTSANSKSSRSHAVFQIILRRGDLNKLHGKFSLIDLAGNERGADNCSSNRQTRVEGAEINKSLLALKECIRALGRQSAYLPFRSSKLTQVLRDSFIGGKKVRTCMIAMISPGLHSVEHTLNTLRYADRVKELTSKHQEKTPQRRVPDVSPTVNPSNSLPDIASQSSHVDRVFSCISLPGGDTQAAKTQSKWIEYLRGTDNDNLTYFNEMTDNYKTGSSSNAEQMS